MCDTPIARITVCVSSLIRIYVGDSPCNYNVATKVNRVVLVRVVLVSLFAETNCKTPQQKFSVAENDCCFVPGIPIIFSWWDDNRLLAAEPILSSCFAFLLRPMWSNYEISLTCQPTEIQRVCLRVLVAKHTMYVRLNHKKSNAFVCGSLWSNTPCMYEVCTKWTRSFWHRRFFSFIYDMYRSSVI